MRARDTLDAVAALAEESAGATHAHPLARAGAVAHAVALACIADASEDHAHLGERLCASICGTRLVASTFIAAKIETAARLARDRAPADVAVRALGNGVLAEEAVPFALFAFLRWGPSFESVVRNSILAGGDTDTIAAMSGALAGAYVGDAELPPKWLARMERGARGLDHVLALADATFALRSGGPG